MARRGQRKEFFDPEESLTAAEPDTDMPVKKTKRKKKNRKRQLILRGSLITGLSAAVLGSAAYCVIDRKQDAVTMGCRLSVCGEDVSWLSVEEAAEKIEDAFQNTKVVFKENKKDIYRVSLKDAGYSLDMDALKNALTDIRKARPECHMLFEKHKDMTIPYQVIWNDEQVRSAFASEKMDNGTERVASQDAYIVFNDAASQFEIVPDTLGNVIDDQKLMNQIQTVLNESFAENLLSDEIPVRIDDSSYQVAKITKDNKKLNKKLKTENKQFSNYFASSVTYKFGDVKEKLTKKMIKEWIHIDGGEIFLDEDAMRSYIEELGAAYNTQYIPRYFDTSYGDTVVIENNEYGYWIDEDAEYEQLVKDISSGSHVSREPVYKSVGYMRNGTDDLCGNYIEVDLTSQRLWLYVDGGEILTSDIVTGQPKGTIDPETGLPEDRSTYEGSYPISYKEKDATLSSDIYGYETKVSYWMPFVYGQGLHDAGWRSSFGGTTYLYDGSHGCVNLPTDVAATIFEYVDTNFPVILYKSGPDPETPDVNPAYIIQNPDGTFTYADPSYAGGMDLTGETSYYAGDYVDSAYGTEGNYDVTDSYGAADIYADSAWGGTDTTYDFGY